MERIDELQAAITALGPGPSQRQKAKLIKAEQVGPPAVCVRGEIRKRSRGLKNFTACHSNRDLRVLMGR